MHVRKICHSQISWVNTDLTDFIAKQAEFNFDFI